MSDRKSEFEEDFGLTLSALHGWATSNAIASLLLHKNEPNRVDSKRARKDEEIGPIPSLPAQFVEKWRLLQDGGMHQSVALISAKFFQRTSQFGNFQCDCETSVV